MAREFLRRQLAVSLESDENGQREQELEYTFYGKLANPDELNNAYAARRIEQWDVPLLSEEGKLRIRMVSEGAQAFDKRPRRYLMCTKIDRQGRDGEEEVEAEITQHQFEHMRELGDNGRTKTRYYFQVEDQAHLVWEIDVFKTQQGEDSLWVKVDLEVEEPLTEIPPWPVTFTEIITNQKDEQDDDEKATISQLWDDEWMRIDNTADL